MNSTDTEYRLEGQRRGVEVSAADVRRWTEDSARLLALARAVADGELPGIRGRLKTRSKAEARKLARGLQLFLGYMDASHEPPDGSYRFSGVLGPEELTEAARLLRSAFEETLKVETINRFLVSSRPSIVLLRVGRAASRLRMWLEEIWCYRKLNVTYGPSPFDGGPYWM